MPQIRSRNIAFRKYYHGPLGRGRFVLTVVGVIGVIAILGAGLERIFVDGQRRHFQSVPCYIESSQVSREAGRDERFLPAWHYVPTVKYRYEAAGTVYTSEAVSSRQTPMVGRLEADEFLQKFGPGMMATCYVDPGDPSEAMLMLPHDGNVALWAKLGGIAIGLACIGLLVLHYVGCVDTRLPVREPRAPGWGEIDSGPQDALSKTRGILREHLER